MVPSPDPKPLHEQHLPSGVAYGLLAALSLALMGFMVKLIGDRASTGVSLFARFTVGMILILPWVLKNPAQAIITSQPKQLFTRSFFTLLSIGGFFYALSYIPLANAILLNSTYPLFVPIVVWFFYRIHTPKKAWFGIVLGFIGVVFVLKPGAALMELASGIAFLSGCTASIAIVLVRALTKTTPVIQILFYNHLIGILIMGLLLPFIPHEVEPGAYLLLFLVGLFGIIYYWFNTMALAKAPARSVSPMIYFSVVFGVLADFLYWGKVLDPFTLIGICAVILGGIITIRYSQK